jgi:hypothetical protein
MAGLRDKKQSVATEVKNNFVISHLTCYEDGIALVFTSPLGLTKFIRERGCGISVESDRVGNSKISATI